MNHGALMPLRGSGEHDVVKHREALWQRWRAEIVRESGNRGALAAAEARALHDHEVAADPELVSRIRAFADECRAHLTHEHDAAAPHHTVPTPRSGPVGPLAAATGELPRDVIERLEHEFHYHLAHFNEVEARNVLDRMRQARRRDHDERLQRMVLRRARYERMIHVLTDAAKKASAGGDGVETGRALRRLSSIHTAHPHLLTDARFAKIRDEIIDASEEREHREAARQIVAKERMVAGEIKHLAAAVHRFHQVARAMPHEREEYRQAEAAYHRIAGEVKSHDEEWMAGLILELADLLADWDEPPPGARKQVDQFLKSVRSAMAHIRIEMRQIERGE